MKKSLLVAIPLAGMVMFSGCTTRLGELTVASSNNVGNLNYSLADKTRIKSEGSACARQLFIIPINQQDNLLQRAMDDAIENGQKRGVDGDLLINVRITQSSLPLIVYNHLCYNVKGDLVKLK